MVITLSVYTKKYNSADEMNFKRDVEKPGIRCVILHIGDAVELRDG